MDKVSRTSTALVPNPNEIFEILDWYPHERKPRYKLVYKKFISITEIIITVTNILSMISLLFLMPVATIPALIKCLNSLYEVYTGYGLIFYAVDLKKESRNKAFIWELMKSYTLPSYFGVLYTPQQTATAWRNYLLGALPDKILNIMYPSVLQEEV